jgi:hypothetical protein
MVKADCGYVLGKNLTYVARRSLGDNSKLPSLVQELKATEAPPSWRSAFRGHWRARPAAARLMRFDARSHLGRMHFFTTVSPVHNKSKPCLTTSVSRGALFASARGGLLRSRRDVQS